MTARLSTYARLDRDESSSQNGLIGGGDTNLKKKHLNQDCPHLVPLDYKVIRYGYEDEDRGPRHWWSWFFCGTESDDDDSPFGSPKKPKRGLWWSVFGCGFLLIACTMVVVIRPSPFSLTFK